MRTVDNFFDYELIDADDGMRLHDLPFLRRQFSRFVEDLFGDGRTGKGTSAGIRRTRSTTEAQAAADTGRDSDRSLMSGRYLLKN